LIAETDEEKALIELGNENKRKRLLNYHLFMETYGRTDGQTERQRLKERERQTDRKREADIRSAFVNPLIAETDEEKALIELGNENKRKRLV
jgi:hypothetical protein